MSLPSAPHSRAEADAPLREGSTGWPVYALQSGLRDAAGSSLILDGDFGMRTDSALRVAQARWGLEPDGVAGPATRRALIEAVCRRLDRDAAGLPDGLARNMARSEGGDNPAAVNDSVAGGVDCGLWQYRCYGPPFEREQLGAAFQPYRAGIRACDEMLSRAAQYMRARWVGSNSRRALRCAVMHHNWPYGAGQWAETGTVSNPNGIASWVPQGVKFPDGAPVRTRREWMEFYAMGGSHGEAVMFRGVF